jgi:hypothetical protein
VFWWATRPDGEGGATRVRWVGRRAENEPDPADAAE